MNYPVVYSVIETEEMTYISGGSPDFRGLFNYLIGDYLRSTVLGDARSVVWNSAKSNSLQPAETWAKNFQSMGIFGKAGYLYGVFYLGQTILAYLDK